MSGPLVVFLVGTGARPEEAFGADWRDVELSTGIFTVRRGYAKGRLKEYPKTVRSRRRVPMRSRVTDALARRMGTSLQMIDRTYGHLARGADDYERRLLDAFDACESVGRAVDAQEDEAAA